MPLFSHEKEDFLYPMHQLLSPSCGGESVDFEDIKLMMRVRIGSKLIPLQEVLEMKIGSVVQFETPLGDELEILVGNSLIARGKLVNIDGYLGMKISEISTKQERLKGLRVC